MQLRLTTPPYNILGSSRNFPQRECISMVSVELSDLSSITVQNEMFRVQ